MRRPCVWPALLQLHGRPAVLVLVVRMFVAMQDLRGRQWALPALACRPAESVAQVRRAVLDPNLPLLAAQGQPEQVQVPVLAPALGAPCAEEVGWPKQPRPLKHKLPVQGVLVPRQLQRTLLRAVPQRRSRACGPT